MSSLSFPPPLEPTTTPAAASGSLETRTHFPFPPSSDLSALVTEAKTRFAQRGAPSSKSTLFFTAWINSDPQVRYRLVPFF